MLERIGRFFRTPKGLFLLILLPFLAIGVRVEGWHVVAPGLFAAVLTCAAIDLPILRARTGRWSFPSGAVLTGLLIAMILSPHEPWHAAAAAGAVAIGSKYIVRSQFANVFNPAALGLVVTFYLFDTGQNWWGAITEVPMTSVVLTLLTGVFIADRLNKLAMVLAFLGAYFLLFTGVAFAGQTATVAEIFRQPDLQAVLFFAFFLLTDPPTSPAKVREQVICGLLVAVSAFAIFESLGAAHYLLSGVLVGNLWEAWRRHVGRVRRESMRPALA